MWPFFPDVVADVLDPTRGHLGHVDESLLTGILLELDEGPEVLDLGHRSNDQLPLLGEAHKFSHYSTTPTSSP
jgi:hypothetical protein